MEPQNTNKILQRLRTALTKERLGHALLFLGSSKKEKLAVTKQLAAALLCERTNYQQEKDGLSCLSCTSCKQVFEEKQVNVRYVVSEAESGIGTSNEIRIGAVREIVREQRLKGFNEKPQVWVVPESERLTQQAANALLKTLEEPQANQYLFLLAPLGNSVLATISSRCQRLVFPSHKDTLVDEKHEQEWKQLNSIDFAGKNMLIEKWAKDKENLLHRLADFQRLTLEEAKTKATQDTNGLSLELLLNRTELLETAQRDLGGHVNPQLVLEEFVLRGRL